MCSDFMSVARSYADSRGLIRCPCKKCENELFQRVAESSPDRLAMSGPSLRDRNELPPLASTSGIKHVRGSTHGIALLKARTGGKLTVHIPDGRMGGDDKVSSMLRVILVRSFDIMSHLRQDDFQLDNDRTEDRITMMSTMNTMYRTHRNRMFQHYSVFNSKEEALEHLYPDMNKEEWTHVCDLFASEEFQEKIETLQLQHESKGKSYTEVEIFVEVLGTKVGYVRGLGRSVRSVGSSSSTVSVDLSQRLEEARLEIEEMRARQMEYEALLVKRLDMEQTMREHLQMIEEKQRKKDKELM
ncbi:hypothetical protein CJ030_MR7G000058 [Morella rubra]|uniref:Transposase-associated domain-containing protein n=1 Tax=Morella rubra TaxID=262757 RepID=A0A6A1V2K6_9ROSI|nr:hypothetical protein CJ030_MR7G000058 [Morella rubra]